MNDRLEIYRLAFIAKLYKLSGEIFDVKLDREEYAVDYRYVCCSHDGLSRGTIWFDDFTYPELSIDDINKNAQAIWKNIKLDRSLLDNK